jgi:hypothetical protein
MTHKNKTKADLDRTPSSTTAGHEQVKTQMQRKFFTKPANPLGKPCSYRCTVNTPKKTTNGGKHGTAAKASGRSKTKVILPEGRKAESMIPRSARRKVTADSWGLSHWFHGLRQQTIEILRKVDRHEHPGWVTNDMDMCSLLFGTCLDELALRSGDTSQHEPTPKAIQNARSALAAVRALILAMIEAEIANA